MNKRTSLHLFIIPIKARVRHYVVWLLEQSLMRLDIDRYGHDNYDIIWDPNPNEFTFIDLDLDDLDYRLGDDDDY